MYLWSFIFVYIKCQVISIINWVFEIEFMKLITHPIIPLQNIYYTKLRSATPQ